LTPLWELSYRAFHQPILQRQNTNSWIGMINPRVFDSIHRSDWQQIPATWPGNYPQILHQTVLGSRARNIYLLESTTDAWHFLTRMGTLTESEKNRWIACE
jgi:hypothetical protein